jgi:hypothetical protein
LQALLLGYLKITLIFPVKVKKHLEINSLKLLLVGRQKNECLPYGDKVTPITWRWPGSARWRVTPQCTASMNKHLENQGSC